MRPVNTYVGPPKDVSARESRRWNALTDQEKNSEAGARVGFYQTRTYDELVAEGRIVELDPTLHDHIGERRGER